MNHISKQTISVSFVFIFNGLLFGTWASRIPKINELFNFSEMGLSALLLLLAAGAISSFPIAGRLTDKIDASRLSMWLCILYPIPFVLIGLSDSVTLLAISLFLFGWIHGAMDVSMNAWGTEIEGEGEKTLMPFFHAMFSFGAGVGAASGILAAALNIELFFHFIIVSLVAIPVYVWVRKNSNKQVRIATKNESKQTFSFPRGKLLLVALVAFSCALGEGAMADWASVYMFSEVNSSHAQAALAYTIFSIFMVLTRLGGQRIIKVLGVVNTVKTCAISSMIGAILLVTVTNTQISYFAFALLGIGYAIIMPLAFSKAAKINKENTGTAIAGIAMFAYGGMLLGPVLIGVLAELSSLKSAFCTFIILSVFVLLSSNQFNDVRNNT